MQTISLKNFRTLLFNLKGCTAVSLTARTKPELKGGKECPFIGLEKMSTINGLINFNYENSVDKQREREGNDNIFVAKPRSWGYRLYQNIGGERRNIPFVANNWSDTPVTFEKFEEFSDTELYLEIKMEKVLTEIFILPSPMGFVQVDKAKIYNWLRKKTEDSQELEKEIVLKDYKIKNIKLIHIFGEAYTLE